MTRKVFNIRPEPGFSATRTQGRALGLDMTGEPLFTIEPVAWDMSDMDADGLLIGSANVFRHAGDALKLFLKLPVFAVGETTAQIAQAQGFRVQQCGTGGLQQLLDTLSGQSLKLLRLAAQDRVTLLPPPQVSIVERVVYRSAPRAMSDETQRQLAEGGIVLLHSARAAGHFSEQCDAHAIDRSGLAIAALAPRVAAAAGQHEARGWKSVETAATPDDAALLALARYMCNRG